MANELTGLAYDNTKRYSRDLGMRHQILDTTEGDQGVSKVIEIWV